MTTPSVSILFFPAQSIVDAQKFPSQHLVDAPSLFPSTAQPLDSPARLSNVDFARRVVVKSTTILHRRSPAFVYCSYSARFWSQVSTSEALDSNNNFVF